MIIRITNQCHMDCNHCLIEASSPNGKHMSLETFNKAISFARLVHSPALIISGGEPTEHPKFIELITYLAFIKKTTNFPLITMIASNGTFIHNEKIKNFLLSIKIPVQITNDKRFYPIKLDANLFNKETFKFVKKISNISPSKRTIKSNINSNVYAPSCYNLRSFTRGFGFINAMNALARLQKICILSVNIDGTVVAGESDVCYPICDVSAKKKNIKNIEKKISNMSCSCCGLTKKLSIKEKQSIGECEREVMPFDHFN